MNTGIVMVGRAEAGLMVCVPLPEISNLMTAPPNLFACWIAARRVQLSLPSLQETSPVLLSAPSQVESTM